MIEELLLVKGVDAGALERLKPYITLYGEGRINVNTAPDKVLLSCGFRYDIVEKIITYRNGADKTEATVDDNIFEGPSHVAVRLSGFYDLNENDIEQINIIAEKYLTGTSNYFTIQSEARLRNHKRSLTTTAVADRNRRILYWRESM